MWRSILWLSAKLHPPSTFCAVTAFAQQVLFGLELLWKHCLRGECCWKIPPDNR